MVAELTSRKGPDCGCSVCNTGNRNHERRHMMLMGTSGRRRRDWRGRVFGVVVGGVVRGARCSGQTNQTTGKDGTKEDPRRRCRIGLSFFLSFCSVFVSSKRAFLPSSKIN